MEIFSPDMQASILYAQATHISFETAESLAELRAQLPQNLLTPLRYHPRGEGIPANNPSAKKRKRINESIKNHGRW